TGADAQLRQRHAGATAARDQAREVHRLVVEREQQRGAGATASRPVVGPWIDDDTAADRRHRRVRARDEPVAGPRDRAFLRAQAPGAGWLWAWTLRTRPVAPDGSSVMMSPSATLPLQTVPVMTVPAPASANTRSTGRRKTSSPPRASTVSMAASKADRSADRP